MDNLKIYNSVATVPDNAKKTIQAGRIKGMTDINPMWRIKTLTEQFGVCGFGWKYVITDKLIIEGADGVVCAFVDIDLFVKIGDQWSEAIQGTGGSQFVSVERNGKYTSDECFKMALTDALSVACKALGIGANVYWAGGGGSKYDKPDNPPTPPKQDKPKTQQKPKTPRELLIAKLQEKGIDLNTYAVEKCLTKDTPAETYTKLLAELGKQ
jgi:hypothetical protein